MLMDSVHSSSVSGLILYNTCRPLPGIGLALGSELESPWSRLRVQKAKAAISKTE